jgi:hypothetical protein
MLGWKLWRALLNPKSAPIFRRAMLMEQSIGCFGNIWIVIAFLLGVACWPGIVVAAPLIIPIVITAYGVSYAVSIAGLISREREKQIYEMFCLTPPGPLGVNWQLATGRLHHEEELRRRHFLMILSILAGLAHLVLLATLTYQGTAKISITETALTLLSNAILTATFYLDYIQSTVLSVLMGILVPTFPEARLSERLLSGAAFVLLQIASYLLIWLMLAGSLRLVPDGMLFRWFANPLIPLGCALLIFGLRAVSIQVMWRILLTRLNFNPSELDIILAEKA